MSFTPQQQAAIEHDGHLLIVAGPGSGKTSTSVAKACRILADPSRSLIMVTFTKEGAEEMRRRLEASLQNQGLPMPTESRLLVATFHSIAIKHLFRHVPRRKVMSPQQQGLLLRDAAAAAHVPNEDFQELHHEFESYMYAADRSELSMSRMGLALVNQYLNRLHHSGQVDLYTIMRDCALKVDEGAIPPLPFTDMLVDESQDTDELQRVWIFAHARAGIRVTMVGDDDQSIYEWRQALGYAGMKRFLDEFNSRRIELGDNFRCRSEILSHAAHLIAHNQMRLGKNLVARRGPGGGICAIQSSSVSTQCEDLAKLIQDTPQQHTNTVVLARKNRSLDTLEMELRSREIHYKRVGSSIWDHSAIAGYLGFLQTLIDSTPVGLLSIFQQRGISPEVSAEFLRKMGGHASEFLDGNVPDLDSGTPSEIEQLRKLAKDCAYWRRQLRGGQLGGSVREVVLEVGDVYKFWVRSPKIRELLEMCARILGDMNGTLSARLRTVSKRSSKLNDIPIILMTMHGSKGLEFETVHVIDAKAPDEGEGAQVESERRLMYVALTRAKARCLVWYSGEPHPTIKEAGIPIRHRQADSLEVIKNSA